MSIINEEMLQRDISLAHFAPCYIIFGDDIYLKKHYTDVLCKKNYGGDAFFNLQKFEGDCDLQDVFDAVNQFPMMADKKCVVLSDYDFSHCSKADFDKLCALLNEPLSGCTFILCFNALEFDFKKGNKEQKLIKSAETVGGKVVCLDHRNPQKLAAMLSAGAKKRNVKLDNSIALKLVENSGEDIGVLQNELEKLCNYCENGVITEQDIIKVSSKSVEASVYDYVKEITACNTDKALKLLDDMFYLKIEPIVILHTAASVYIDMLRVECAQENGIPLNTVSEDFSYRNRAFLLDRAKNTLKKVGQKQLKLSFEALIKADKLLKSYAADEKLILEQLTVNLIYIITKGDTF